MYLDLSILLFEMVAANSHFYEEITGQVRHNQSNQKIW